MRLCHRLLILAAIQGACLVFLPPVSANQIGCHDSPVTFEHNGPVDLKCLCSTTRAAVSFLQSIGLETTGCITIKLVDHIPSQHDHILIGAFNSVSQRVTLLTYPKAVQLAEKTSPAPGFDLSEELWCSYAAHELAHVVSSQHLHPKIKAHTASEYISAVTQLTVLPQAIRQKILERYSDVSAYQTRSEMSELYFLIDPNRFAVKCYRHFIAQENPRAFIETLIREGNGH